MPWGWKTGRVEDRFSELERDLRLNRRGRVSHSSTPCDKLERGILNAVSGLEPDSSCFENVNLYPWLAHMLGLAPPKTDGSLNVLAGTLRDGGDDAAK